MFDIGWSELLLIGIVALIVVGPKDLPGMFRTLGRFTAKARAMGREFQRAMDEAARESGVKDVADDLKAATSKKNLGLDTLEKAASEFEKWNPAKAVKTATAPAKPTPAPDAAPAATAAPAEPAVVPVKKAVRRSAAKAVPAKTAAKPKAADIAPAAKAPRKRAAPKKGDA